MAEGSITPEEYMTKLDHFITSRTLGVKGLNNQYQLRACYDKAAEFYKSGSSGSGKTTSGKTSSRSGKGSRGAKKAGKEKQ